MDCKIALRAILTYVMLAGIIWSPFTANATPTPPLKCTPSKIGNEETLQISFRPDLGKHVIDISIRPPKGETLLLDASKFRTGRQNTLELKTGSVVSTVHNQQVVAFSQQGKYKISVGNLETDMPIVVGNCTVQFSNRVLKVGTSEKPNAIDTQPSESADQRHDVRGEVTINLGKAISDGLKGLFSGTADTDIPNNSERQSSASPAVRSGKAQKAGESSFPKSLIGIFRKSSAHEGGRVGWPRIAVTILDDGSTGCTGMRAKVWHTASRSEVKSFHVCEGDVSRLAGIGGVKGAGTSQQMKDLLLAMPSRSNQYMAGVDRVIDAPSECFASEEDLRRLKRKRPAVCDDLKKSVNYKVRTEGPTPAPEPLPDEARSMFNRVNDRFSDIALITQYDPSIDDRRLWLVRYDLQH